MTTVPSAATTPIVPSPETPARIIPRFKMPCVNPQCCAGIVRSGDAHFATFRHPATPCRFGNDCRHVRSIRKGAPSEDDSMHCILYSHPKEQCKWAGSCRHLANHANDADTNEVLDHMHRFDHQPGDIQAAYLAASRKTCPFGNACRHANRGERQSYADEVHFALFEH